MVSGAISEHIIQVGKKLVTVRRELLWVVTGQVLTALGGVAAIKVLTTLLGPSGYGQLALGITIAGVVQLVAYGPIDQTVLRFVSVHRERGSLGVFFAAVKRIHGLVATLVFPVTVLAALAVYAFFGGDWSWLVLGGSLFGIASGFYGTVLSIHSAFRERKTVALHQSADIWLRLLLAVVGVMVFSRSGNVALFGYVVAASLMATSIVYFTVKLPIVVENIELSAERAKSVNHALNELVRFGRPFVFFAIVGMLSAYADRWVIFDVLGEEAVGRYAAIYQLANAPIAVMLGIMNQFAVPILFDRAGAITTDAQSAQSTTLMYQAIRVFGLGMLGVLGFAYMFGEQLIRLATTQEFVTDSNLLWIMILGVGIFHLAQLLVLKGLSHNVTEGYVVPKLLQAIALVSLLFAFTNSMGILGAAWALVVSSTVYLCAVIWVNQTIRVTVKAAGGP